MADDDPRPLGWRGVAVPLLDGAAGLLLAAALSLLFFVNGQAFLALTAVATAAALTAACLSRTNLRTPFDLPVAVFVALTVVSALVSSRTAGSWAAVGTTLLAIASGYGVVWTLRSEKRLALFVAAIVTGVAIVGAQAFVWHAAVGLDRRPMTYPVTPQWSGYPELGLLAVLALPFALGVVATGGAGPALAGTVVCAALGIEAIGTYSRAAWLAGVAGCGCVLAVGLRGARRRLWPMLVLVGLVAMSAAATRWNPYLKSFVEVLGDTSTTQYVSRVDVWGRTLRLVGNAPLLGVGPGNYTTAIVQGGTTARIWKLSAHAHNMILHVAAEVGVPAALAFLLIWWKALAALAGGAVSSGRLAAVRLGLFGALLVFFLRGLVDHFLGGVATSGRFNILLWLLLGAAAATARLSRRPS